MLLSRTRAKMAFSLKRKIFSALDMQTMLDTMERHALEDSMGFRGQWDEHRRFQIDQLKKRGLEADGTVLEIGCGPLTAGIPVIEYLAPGGYVGVDVRESVLNMSWQQVGKAGLSAKNPMLLRADDFGDSALGVRTFDFVWSFSVLYHMSDPILDACFASVSQRLDGGSFYANVMTDMESSTWLQFPFLRRTVDDYAIVASRYGLKTEDLGPISALGFTLSGEERNNRFLRFSRG